jgi:hypothetical protein
MYKMKKISLIMILCFLLSFSNLIGQQADCKVLLPAIGVTYKGECKKGLAHGEGEAQGQDSYKGNFKKGFPEGKGVYTWQNGDKYEGTWSQGKREGKGTMTIKSAGKDSLITGFWENDQYKGKERIIPYKVILKRNVDDIRMTQSSKIGALVTIKILRSGSRIPYSELMIASTGGSVNESANPPRIENINFPIEVKVTYKCMNKLNSMELSCEGQFEIKEPGIWEVVFNH